jgi:hypothetical protein
MFLKVATIEVVFILFCEESYLVLVSRSKLCHVATCIPNCSICQVSLVISFFSCPEMQRYRILQSILAHRELWVVKLLESCADKNLHSAIYPTIRKNLIHHPVYLH